MPKISFIIPVYNAEQYLRETIESVVIQIQGNELILINDGSTDGSGRICDEYAAAYSEVSVLHTTNGGVSRARNLGVEQAHGEYIVFLDSDDLINREFVERFAAFPAGADVIFYPMWKLYPNGSFIPMGDGLNREGLMGKTPDEVLSYIAGCPKFPASPCGRLVRLDFLREHGITFAFNRKAEDYDWTYSLLRYAKSYDFFDGGIYTYRKVENSRSMLGDPQSVDDQLSILRYWENVDADAEFRVWLNAFLAYEYAMILPHYGALQKKDRAMFRKQMGQAAHLLRYGRTKKLCAIRLAVMVLGIDGAAGLLNAYVAYREKGIKTA